MFFHTEDAFILFRIRGQTKGFVPFVLTQAMDQLSNKKLATIAHKDNVSIPGNALLQLPEKVLQFGTGVLLRGLTDYYIDKANKLGLFNGRVVVVKSTPGSPPVEFAQQDNLYTQCIRGVQQGERINEYSINASISRVISAQQDWQAILNCAADPGVQIIISNTTEIGISLNEQDTIASGTVPESFPGKLLACLYHRYHVFAGAVGAGMVILPTELLPNNGEQLKNICIQLALLNNMDDAFIQWLQDANDFCNTLVDCIVPGALPSAEASRTETYLGFTDKLMIMSEAYRLWAIETSKSTTREILSFAAADPGIIISDDIGKFRDLKLRLLNGAHTFSCGLALLSGFETVKEAMNNASFEKFIRELMISEIAPTLVSEHLQPDEAVHFAKRVLDRFRNPHIEHRWASISAQYTAKMLMRNIPTLLSYYQLYGKAPQHMALGFAAYLYFMRSEQTPADRYFRHCYGKQIYIEDSYAEMLYHQWHKGRPEETVYHILSDSSLWRTDLSELPGFGAAVLHHLLKLKTQSKTNYHTT